MIDIHSHLLFGVDDGAGSFEESEEMLREAGEQGVTDMILTPHYRKGMFGYPREEIRKRFLRLSEFSEGIGIRLYLGTEYHADSDMIRSFMSGRCASLGGSEYILVEFGTGDGYGFIRHSLEEAIFNGFVPVIAHAERYGAFIEDHRLLNEFRMMGALVQLNAGSILGEEGRRAKLVCKNILKDRLCDIIASDCHNMDNRGICLEKCYRHIEKKYGEEEALRMFLKNPGAIIKKAERPAGQ